MYDELIKRLRDWSKICAQYDGSIDQLHDEAADAIEELTDTNVGKWIPVTERLPKFNENVLVYSAHSGLICIDANIQFDRNATHWMPLPQPPKEE